MPAPPRKEGTNWKLVLIAVIGVTIAILLAHHWKPHLGGPQPGEGLTCASNADCHNHGYCDTMRNPPICLCVGGWYSDQVSSCSHFPTFRTISGTTSHVIVTGTSSPFTASAGFNTTFYLQFNFDASPTVDLKVELFWSAGVTEPILIGAHIPVDATGTLEPFIYTGVIPSTVPFGPSDTAYFKVSFQNIFATEPYQLVSADTLPFQIIHGYGWAPGTLLTTQQCSGPCETTTNGVCVAPCGSGHTQFNLPVCKAKDFSGAFTGEILPESYCEFGGNPWVPIPIESSACVHPTEPLCRYAWSLPGTKFQVQTPTPNNDQICTQRCRETPDSPLGSRQFAQGSPICKNLNNMAQNPVPDVGNPNWYCPRDRLPALLGCGNRPCQVVPGVVPATPATRYGAGEGWYQCANNNIGCDLSPNVDPSTWTGLLYPSQPRCWAPTKSTPIISTPSYVTCSLNNKPPSTIRCIPWESCTGRVPNPIGSTEFDITMYNPDIWLSFPPLD